MDHTKLTLRLKNQLGAEKYNVQLLVYMDLEQARGLEDELKKVMIKKGKGVSYLTLCC